MIVFNLVAVLEAIVALVPAVLVFGLQMLLGIEHGGPFLIALFGSFTAIDMFWRFAASGDRTNTDGEVEKGWGWLNFLVPWGGGHVFFIPNWISGGAVTLVLMYATVAWMFGFVG